MLTKHWCCHCDTALKRSWYLCYRKCSQMLTKCWFLVDIALTKNWYFPIRRVPKAARFPTPNCWHEQYINISSTANWYWQTIDILLPGVLTNNLCIDVCLRFSLTNGWWLMFLFWGCQNVDFLLINWWCFVNVRKKRLYFISTTDLQDHLVFLLKWSVIKYNHCSCWPELYGSGFATIIFNQIGWYETRSIIHLYQVPDRGKLLKNLLLTRRDDRPRNRFKFCSYFCLTHG